ncbi:nucleotidyltransferase domain-containing protein [Methanolapillus africanus]
MSDIIEKMKPVFQNRLLFVGLQGSYQRNEENETSDFDVVVVLDQLSVSDLKVYQSIIKTMPESEKACGFICGADELLNWPLHEIFPLLQDTDGYFGDLNCLLPAYGKNDIQQNVNISAANLYHAVCHLYLFGNECRRTEDLKPLYKSVFFTARLLEYLRTGVYCPTKTSLVERLHGDEKTLMEISLNWEKYQNDIDENPDAYFERLMEWCRMILLSENDLK